MQLNFELGHVAGVAATLFNLSEIAGARSDLKLAARLSVASQSLFDKVGSPHNPIARQWLEQIAPRAGHSEKSLKALRARLNAMTLPDLIVWATGQ